MRKYVIQYTRKAYDDRKIDWQDYITGIGCNGLKEFKATLKYLKETIGLEYLENEVTILNGDGVNAYTVGTKHINEITDICNIIC